MICIHVCSSYVMSVRYVAAIDHESRGRVAPQGPSDLLRKRTEYGHDIGNLCRHDRVATDNGAKIIVCLDLNQFSNRFSPCFSADSLVPSPSLAFSCSSPSIERVQSSV